MDESNGQQLKQILKDWGKFPAHDEADFNCLLNEVSTALSEGLTGNEMVAVIQNEFMNHIGEPGPDQDIIEVAETISDWWSNKTPK